jgi:glycosyltransferase involved in cell wall biosynthesis
LAQTFEDFELIVVDDGSTDNTREVVRPLQDRLRYVAQKNQGPGAARNTGVAHATGEWIAFLDSDDVWLPNKLSRQVEWSERMRAEICFHDVIMNAEAEGPNLLRRSDLIRRQVPGLRQIDSEILPDSFRLLVEAAPFFLTTSLLLKRSAFIGVGGMAADLLTNQDIELYLRLFPRCRVAFLGECLARYSPGENRAFEVASLKARRNVEKGQSRVILDRIRAYARAFEDRISNDDPERAGIAREGIVSMLRNFAGLCRRSGAPLMSLDAYCCHVLLRTLPFVEPARLLDWSSIAPRTSRNPTSVIHS